MSWMGGRIISLIMMAAVGSIMTLITLSLILHRSDGSLEREAPSTLPPSTSLCQSDLQSSMSPPSPSIISPLPVFAQSPVFLPATVTNSPMNSVETFSLSPYSSLCIDKHLWYDAQGFDSLF
jgi:hypothetical protein